MRLVAGSLDSDFDIVVVGSGASGLTTALRATDSGARVAVLEKSPYLGGTSAVSGGMLWIPASGLPGAGEEDFAATLRYLAHVTAGRADNEVLQSVLDAGPDMLAFLSDAGGPEFTVLPEFPDYHPELDGGSNGGRVLEPVLYSMGGLGDLASAVRPDPRPPFRQKERYEFWSTRRNFPADLMASRRRDGIVARGRALVGPLVSALARHSTVFAVDAPVERLVIDGERVAGVIAQGVELRARYGVVLACGGFEWDDRMCQTFLSGPVRARCSPPGNVGDGIRMAAAVGADLANMNEAWWGVMAEIPGLEADGRALATMVTIDRGLPGSIMVNRFGRRFANEATGYGSLGKVLAAFDAYSYDYANLPTYLVADADYVRRYGVLGADSLDDPPPWLTVADTLEALGTRIGVDPSGLVETVARFNQHASDGADPDFHRGESAYDRYLGDSEADHPNLAPLVASPFVAVELTCGAFGTRGGVRTDSVGQALNPFDEPIPGLFAVGNNAAHPIPFGYMGPGTTLGPGMTMAFAAGRALAESR